MRHLFNKIKAGVQIAPAFIILIYLALGSLDLLTTYLSTPDLKYEGNWVVKKFSFSWPVLILYAFINYAIVITAFVLALEYLDRYIKLSLPDSFAKIILESKRNIKLLLCVIILGIFYSHVVNIAHIIFNNYLGYIYLRGPEGWLKNISFYHFDRQKYFLFYIQYVTYLPGFVFAFIKVENIRKKATRRHATSSADIPKLFVRKSE